MRIEERNEFALSLANPPVPSRRRARLGLAKDGDASAECNLCRGVRRIAVDDIDGEAIGIVGLPPQRVQRARRGTSDSLRAAMTTSTQRRHRRFAYVNDNTAVEHCRNLGRCSSANSRPQGSASRTRLRTRSSVSWL